MLQRILLEIDKDSEVVFYYAGHGVQIGGANYLIPVDAAFKDAYDLPFEAVSLTTIVNVLGARARTQIVILDSCRSNPFAGALVLADITGTPSAAAGRLQRPDRAGQLAPRLLHLAGRERLRRHRAEQPLHRRPRRGGARHARGGRRHASSRRCAGRSTPRTEGRQVPWESSTLVQSVSFGLPDAASLLADGESARRSWLSQPMPQATALDPAAQPAAGAPIALTARLDQEIGVGSHPRRRPRPARPTRRSASPRRPRTAASSSTSTTGAASTPPARPG